MAVNIGIIGFGTVGAGTVEVLIRNRDLIKKRIGEEIKIKRIADLDIERDRGVPIDKSILTKNAMEIIEDPDIHIVAELIGGTTTARELIISAMQKGKHVVTANKALLAEHGKEIYESARRYGVCLGFEASVAGGIPIIGVLKKGLAANKISSVLGILNGTSNYILTRMKKQGLTYKEVVSEAVQLGIAEDPPTLDVDGTDAAHKLAIIVALIVGSPVDYKDIYKEGITEITPDDIRFSDEFGYTIKLLAIARHHGNRVEARVHPAMIPKESMLANVDGVFNAIYVEGDFVGPNLYYGLGAGRKPTGSAVASDIISLARHIIAGQNYPPPLGFNCAPDEALRIQPMEELRSRYYFRVSAVDRPGVLSSISGILGKYGISIESVIQKGRRKKENDLVPIVMLTHEAVERDVRRAISEIDRLAVVKDKTVVIRVINSFLFS